MTKSSRIGVFGIALRSLFVFLTVVTPLAGVWLASSLAAYGNRSTKLPVLTGVLLRLRQRGRIRRIPFRRLDRSERRP